MICERRTERRRVTHQRAAGFERRVKPLVWIDGDRVGEANGVEIIGCVW